MAIPILFSGSYSAPSGGVVDTTTTAFRSPIYADNSAKTLLAWAAGDRMNASHTGNAITVKRASDSGTFNYGFNADGELAASSVITDMTGTTGSVNALIDQMGSANSIVPKSGAVIPFIASDAITRTGPNRNSSTGVIDTLSTTDGAPLMHINGYANTATVPFTGVTGLTSLEFHYVYAMAERKCASSKIDSNEPTTTTDEETILEYAFGTSKLRISKCPNSTITHYNILDFGTGLGTDKISDTDYPCLEKNGVRIESTCIHPTEFFHVIDGRKIDVQALDAIGQAMLAGGAMDEGTLYIGQRSSGGTTQTPNFYVYAVIVTEQLTDTEREELHLRLGEAVKQHKLSTLTNWKAKFTHMNWLGNMDGTTGISPAVKGDLVIKANVNTTINTDTPSHTLEYTSTKGWKGIRNDDGANNANLWRDTGGVGPGLTSMSVLLVYEYEDPQGTNLSYPIAWGKDNWETDPPAVINGSNKNDEFSVGLGLGHNDPQLQVSVSSSLDTNGICGSVNTTNPDTLGGQVSQPNGKYNDTLSAGDWNDHVDTTNVNTLAADVTSSEVDSGGVLYPAGTELDNATMLAALNLKPPTAENATNPGSNMSFYTKPQYMAMTQVMVLNSGATYNHSETQENRDPEMLTGDAKLWTFPTVGNGLYSTACQFAEKDGNAPVLHIATGSMMQTGIYQAASEGTLVFVGIYEGEWTESDVQEIEANIRYVRDGSLAA